MSEGTATRLDAATLTILASSFTSIAREMGATLFRAAFSGIVREAEDASTCLLDAEGSVVAQEFHIQAHMASMSPIFRFFRRSGLLGEVGPGKVLITNDPYSGAHHLPDVCIFWPIYVDGELLAFAGCIANHVDIGGTTAGAFAGATEIYQEGLRIPAMVVDVDTDLAEGGLLRRMIEANVRVPDLVVGDLNAQLAACRVGERSLRRLAGQYGTHVIREAMHELLAYSERIVRGHIAAIPDGEYRAEDFLDDDGEFSPDPVTIAVRLVVDGSELTVDVGGTDPQSKGPLNCPPGATEAGVALALLPLLFGAEQFEFVNDGCLRPIAIVNPPGTLLHPRPPAPVEQRVLAMYRLYTAIHRAFADADPAAVAASGLESTNVVVFSRQTPERAFVHFEVTYGGLGAGPANDGATAVAMSVANAANVPVEAVEIAFPAVRITRHEVRPGSGGAGRHAGGLGVVREYEVLAEGVVLSAYSDRHRFRPWGLAGGREGASSAHVLIRDGEETVLPSKFTETLRAGDRFRLVTGGGGGYGPPSQRPDDAIARDLLDGWLSADEAAEAYGPRARTLAPRHGATAT